jgi:ABC-type polysaccharide/polyol phosphate transport system ATPase subunit
MRRADIERQFDEIVAFAEVEKFIDTPVKHYSSGMYLRLFTVMTISMVAKPPEPTRGVV